MYIHYLLLQIKQNRDDHDFWDNLDDFMEKYWDIFFCDLITIQNTWNENTTQEAIDNAKILVWIFYEYVLGLSTFEDVLDHAGARKIFREFLEDFISHDKIVNFPLQVVQNP